jgi:hypothetical protein
MAKTVLTPTIDAETALTPLVPVGQYRLMFYRGQRYRLAYWDPGPAHAVVCMPEQFAGEPSSPYGVHGLLRPRYWSLPRWHMREHGG